MRRLHHIARNPFAVALAFGLSMVAATATAAASIYPPVS